MSLRAWLYLVCTRVDIIPREVSVNKLYIETNLFQIGGHFRRWVSLGNHLVCYRCSLLVHKQTQGFSKSRINYTSKTNAQTTLYNRQTVILSISQLCWKITSLFKAQIYPRKHNVANTQNALNSKYYNSYSCKTCKGNVKNGREFVFLYIILREIIGMCHVERRNSCQSRVLPFG